MIGKVSPRGARVAGLIYYLFGPGRAASTPTRTSSRAGVTRPNWSHRCATTATATSGT